MEEIECNSLKETPSSSYIFFPFVLFYSSKVKIKLLIMQSDNRLFLMYVQRTYLHCYLYNKLLEWMRMQAIALSFMNHDDISLKIFFQKISISLTPLTIFCGKFHCFNCFHNNSGQYSE